MTWRPWRRLCPGLGVGAMSDPRVGSDSAVLTVRVERDTVDGGFVVSANEAPGCVSQGETITAALESFTDALTDWAIARALRGMAVPT